MHHVPFHHLRLALYHQVFEVVDMVHSRIQKPQVLSRRWRLSQALRILLVIP